MVKFMLLLEIFTKKHTFATECLKHRHIAKLKY